ncbi:hypothetical protein RBU61_18900 [Tissierella sp. MB52-C2]|uniref:hypothetical protein n=1 Tax=Tissierella sp. MB52-C2 TaxID=3070999 RepID=UPI00280B53E8|nr:hypothetical protein [Tissierella sp. MB52-C2]WMM24971.1 hypothetical protein RBU61_18900 [Tissierella sp. MB52-C2]
MDSTKRIFKFQNRDLKKSIGAFWLIILIINLLSSILSISYNGNIVYGLNAKGGESISFIGANMVSIFIYIIIYGIIMYYEDFALALSFGATRKDFYKSAIVNNILVALIFGIIQGGLHLIEKYFFKVSGYKLMTEFGIFNIATDNILFIILSLSVFFLALFSISNLLGVLQYRFGYKLWIGVGVMAFLGLNLARISISIKTIKMFSNMYLWLYSIFNVGSVFIIEVILSVICYTLGYFLIRKASIGK